MFKGKKPDLAQDISAISYSCFYLISWFLQHNTEITIPLTGIMDIYKWFTQVFNLNKTESYMI